MKFAIISDVHGNYQALKAVIEDAKRQEVDQFICLGDMVGYGPNPAECITAIQELSGPVIRGNHDHDAAGDHDLGHVNETAELSLKWTREQLSSAQRQWLGELPVSYTHLTLPTILLV